MNTQERFHEAVARSKGLAKRPNNAQLLQIYGLYKQATEGDVVMPRPGGFDFKAIAKYNAWHGLKGLPTEEAMSRYSDLIEQLVDKDETR
ncbi:MAG: acyl-CoA-binding protein [Catalinimonas sp.]